MEFASSNRQGRQSSRKPVEKVCCPGLVSTTDQRCRLALKGLVKVCLSTLLCNPAEDINAAASSTRLFIAKTPLHNPLFRQLPINDLYSEFRDSLSIMLQANVVSPLTSNEQDLVRELKKLPQLVSPRRPVQPPTSGPAWVDEVPIKPLPLSKPQRPKGWPTLVLVETWQDPPSGGVLATIEIAPPNPENGDGPETTPLFIENEPTQEEIDDQLPPSLAATDALAQESRHWLSRHQRLVPSDLGRFTPMERKRLANFLQTGLSAYDDETQIAAGILGLMYCTGRDLERVLAFKLGGNGDLRSGGTYHRYLKRPTGAFEPSPALLSQLHQSQDYLELPLPPPLDTWIDSRIGQSSASIPVVLGKFPDEIKQIISDTLEILRDRSRLHRIRIERIPAALPLELTLEKQDPIVTYLLAGNANQAAPMLSYYTCHSVNQLVNIYIRVTRKMMKPT